MAKEMTKVFGENLKREIEKRGITQRQLAKDIGVSPVTVTDWTKGRKMPRIGTIDKICQYFGIDYEELMKQPLTYLKDKEELENANNEAMTMMNFYRQLDEEDKILVKAMFDKLLLAYIMQYSEKRIRM